MRHPKGQLPIPSIHDLPPVQKGIATNVWEAIKEKPAPFLSIACGILFVVFMVLYFVTKVYVFPHFAAVFLELSLAILFVEQIIKPSTENNEARRIKAEKKKSFLRNILRANIDVMVVDSLEEFESITNILSEFSKDGFESHRSRMQYVQTNRKYFEYFDKMRPFHGSVLMDAKHLHAGEYAEFLESWEALLAEAIETVRLVNSKPQYTPFHSWDRLIELYTEIRRQNHSIAYLRQRITPQQERIKLYMTALKVFTTLLLDLSHFGILKESRVASDENEGLARKIWHVWTHRSSRN